VFHRPYLLLSCALLLSACAESKSAEPAAEASLDSAATATTPAAAPEAVPVEGAEAKLLERAGVSLLRTEQGFALQNTRSGKVSELPGRPVLSPEAGRMAIAAGGGVEIWTLQNGEPVREWASGPLAPLGNPLRWEDETTLTVPTAAGGTLLVTNPGPGWMVLEPAG